MSRSLRRGGRWGRALASLEGGPVVVVVNLAVALLIALFVLNKEVAYPEIADPTPDQGSAETLVVVTGEGSADGLVARSLGDVVFTVPRSGPLSDSVIGRLQRLSPTQLVILGGLDIVSQDVAAELASATTASVTRHAGQDRYATAAQAATSTFTAPVRKILIATSEVSQPAVVTSSGHAADDMPVLLVTRDSIPAATTAALRRLRPQHMTIVGDVAAVSNVVRLELQTYTDGEVNRLPAG